MERLTNRVLRVQTSSEREREREREREVVAFLKLHNSRSGTYSSRYDMVWGFHFRRSMLDLHHVGRSIGLFFASSIAARYEIDAANHNPIYAMRAGRSRSN